MKNWFIIGIIFLISSSTQIACEAQEPTYKVTWSNERILPYENAGLPSLSADGEKVVFLSHKDDFSDIWTINSDGTGAKILISESHTDFNSPIWFPDGSKLIFLKNGDFEMWKITADGKIDGPLTEKKYEKFSPVITPNGAKIVVGLLGIDPPGIYSIDLVNGTRGLILATKPFSTLNLPFTISPDGMTILVINGQELIFLNPDGTIKEKKTVSTSLTHGEEPIWSSDGKYIILGNLLYILASGEEIPFLPDDVVRYKETGKPDLVGPKSITLSKDGKKIAFVMEEPNATTYRARIKIMDLVWK